MLQTVGAGGFPLARGPAPAARRGLFNVGHGVALQKQKGPSLSTEAP